MILADTDVLSALAKVSQVSVLYMLLHTPVLSITPGVFRELEHSFTLRRQYALDLFTLLVSGQIQMVHLTSEETTLRDTLPRTLGAGERESIAVARERQGIVLSNESRVAHYCRQNDISCLRLPDILRALWVERLMTRQQVHQIVKDLHIKDHMQFSPATLQAIFVM